MVEYSRGYKMSVEANKIELTGHVDKNGHLKFEADVPFEQGDVKIIVFPSTKTEETEDDIPVDALLQVAQAGGAFDFLNDPEEDIYTMEDGKPVEW